MARPRSKPLDDLNPGDRITLIYRMLPDSPKLLVRGEFRAIEKINGRYWLKILPEDQASVIRIWTVLKEHITLHRKARRQEQ